MRWSAILLASGSTLAASVGLAQVEGPPYRDDRSTAGALVSSYYNAVNRREYARAWSYFGPRKPGSDIESFAAGYAQTERVDLLTGTPVAEGTAGSLHVNLPVAIVARSSDGSEATFSGCFVIKMGDPDQGDAFEPMMIEQARLDRAEGSLRDALPKRCAGHAGDDDIPGLEAAKEMFVRVYSDSCMGMPGSGGIDPESAETHRLSWRYPEADASEPDRDAWLFRFECGVGAYNETHVYFLWDELDGTRPLQFSVPELDIRYAEPDSNERVESIRITGFQTKDRLVNSFFDPDTLTISSAPKWRGIGDASSAGTWLFRQGRFALVKYDVDAAYDGEIELESVLDYDTAP